MVHVFCNNAQSFVSCCGTDGDSSVKDLICMLTYNRMTGRCDGGGVTRGLEVGWMNGLVRKRAAARMRWLDDMSRDQLPNRGLTHAINHFSFSRAGSDPGLIHVGFMEDKTLEHILLSLGHCAEWHGLKTTFRIYPSVPFSRVTMASTSWPLKDGADM